MPNSSSSSGSSSTLSSTVIKLREKLSSVAWVQCDKSSCMKWRRVTKSVTDKLTNDAWWECSMNKDADYNGCHIEEEDLQAFDQLARKARLAVYKSELTPGALVWTKKIGYCHWPAVVTKDPGNDEFWEGGEDEPDKDYYHVEYLGKGHCHGWVMSRHVELFGHGNIDKASQKQKKWKGKKKKRTLTEMNGRPERRFYYGGSVEKAIEEAKSLLPLSLKQRLKRCVFTSVTRTHKSHMSNICSSQQMGSDSLPVAVRHKLSQPVTESGLRDCHNQHPHLPRRSIDQKENQKCAKPKQIKDKPCNKRPPDDLPKVSPRRSKRLCGTSFNLMTPEPVETNNVWFDSDKDQQTDSSDSDRSKILSLEFATSLLDVSKEERFFLDLEIYRTNESRFYERLAQFYRQNGIMETVEAPVWDKMQINLFDFCLAVDSRGGYAKVTANRDWSTIYQELTGYGGGKANANKAKSFYYSNLYPFEQYINGEDYSRSLAVFNKSRHKSRQDTKERKVCTTKKEEETDEDSDEIMHALDELDQLLQTLNQKADRVVPDVSTDINMHPCYHDDDIVLSYTKNKKIVKSPDWNAVTASQEGIANVPEESAQIVPEIDFPSVSSQSDEMDYQLDYRLNEPLLPIYENMEGHVLHDLQAL